jgi:putative ABC transport system ATP-binding protein
MAFIELDKLSKTYTTDAGRVSALSQTNLQIEEGSFLGVMGPSGSGKSTLLTLLGGLALPSTGRMLIDEIDVYALGDEMRADFRREYLGFVFQAYNLIPYLTAIENVMLPLAVTRIGSAQQTELAVDALTRVGLGNRIDHLPNQLSGGEQERVAIARALVNHPPLILADEPTGSLDSATTTEIMNLFSELNREGQTIIMVTHNAEIRPYFDRIVALKDGSIESDIDLKPEQAVAVG